VSLYNETPDGPILPTPVVGMVGLLDDRDGAIPMRWSDGDEIWLLGEPAWDAATLAASELAWRRGRFGGQPSLDLALAVRLVSLLGVLGARGMLRGAHDTSVGGLGVGLARLAIASDRGAMISLPLDAAALPNAGLFGERGGRALVVIAPGSGDGLLGAADAQGVPAARLGVAGGDGLVIGIGEARLSVSLDQLRAAWTTPF
jgi:phosphoribosylformylglycinamidine synthase